MEFGFWLAFAGTWYAYVGYLLVLLVWRALRPRPVRSDRAARPSLSIVLPVYNEAGHLAQRLRDLAALDYPADKLELIVVSDGSDDGSDAIVLAAGEADPRIRLLRVPQRKGKGNALNTGVAQARHEVLVFIDASIQLEPDALTAIVAPFADPAVSCVSGEDRIRGFSGEGLYGRYELFLRRCESDIHSLVGVSGSFYAQRRASCPSFPEGLAPDFVAALHAVSLGHRAVGEESATGWMGAVESHQDEFRRKVRTLLRGMAALRTYAHLLDPRRAGVFALFLWSHKVMRWLVPFFLVAMLVANAALLREPLYAVIGVLHGLFYAVGLLALLGVGQRTRAGKFAGYFLNVNAAIAVAWWQFLRGRRQEVWAPSRR
jgi:glycosyltransferase involved in cell wall biosynthesis